MDARQAAAEIARLARAVKEQGGTPANLVELMALAGKRGLDISAFPAALILLSPGQLPAPRPPDEALRQFRNFARDRPLRAPLVGAIAGPSTKKAWALVYGTSARFRA